MLHSIPKKETAITLPAETPFTIIPGSLASGVLLLCDHADNAFPPGYGTLGLPDEQLERHIAYDPGAASITQHMARLLGAPAVLTRYSRLLIDPNRGEDDPTLIMRLSDGAIIPGNADLSLEERQKRIDLYYRPYHEAVDEMIDAMVAAGRVPVIFSIHSFTENWRGWMRPWHVGVLWDKDPRLAVPLINGLRQDDSLVVGDNEPYTGALRGDCVNKHATMRGLANALIEVRQDLIRDESGQAEWAERLSDLMRHLLDRHKGNATLHSIRHYGSRTDAGPNTQPRPQGECSVVKQQIDRKTATELEAAAFRRLLNHLRNRSDVQNIDMMNLTGFCRNCLSNWYQEAATEKGVELSKDEAREIVYGMPYDEWKAQHQADATPDQLARFETASGQQKH